MHPSPRDALIGTTIADRYDVIGVLGEGGMAVVYEAIQRGLERPVAVKVMRPEVGASGVVAERLAREARALGQVSHPCIVGIYDVGRLDDGRAFVVMPRLEGRDLGAVLAAEGRRPLQEVVALLRGTARGLDLVHRAGIVHRDIKPENLMLEVLANGQRLVRLVDFGLAARIGGDEARLTEEGTVVGTPCYVSPEVAQGRPADARADVYSLACVVFELLAGVPPFDELRPLDTLVRKSREDPPTLRSFQVRTTDAVERALARGLARRPRDRCARAVELLDALEAATDRDGSGGSMLR